MIKKNAILLAEVKRSREKPCHQKKAKQFVSFVWGLRACNPRTQTQLETQMCLPKRGKDLGFLKVKRGTPVGFI